MTWVAALLLVLAFLVLLRILRVPARASAAIARARSAVADLRSSELTDLQKERAMRAHAGALFLAFLVLTALSAAALLLPVGIAWLFAKAGALDFDAVLDATMSWQVLVAATVAGFVVLFAGRR